ncbi:unnamed protein product [Oppiella nova]|uniref:Protein kinase domain-containing protein n=1 Tax=Oppiella nova TaxID=334625 RepID=A0A7R9QSI1_9ACAR|nr:unnamed protein product [Oppiella nova]CAG2172296.1 unnamed protein product [Oppiella nova]
MDIEEGDIIQIKDKVKDSVTIWALYVGEGYVMYYCPRYQRLLRDKLETVSKDKDYCVNNLKEFSQSKQLSVQSADTILATALRVFNRNETFEPNVKTKHNLRIHFVTKCRFGRQFCEWLECKEQVAGHEVFDGAMNVTNIATIEGKYHGEFIKLDQIGTGSFGQVYKLKRKSDKTIHAIKIIQILADIHNPSTHRQRHYSHISCLSAVNT